tara:strand:+ start:1035 stop:1253 length:219 start_codon:yes stop_codon:yes gene_type:complete
LRHGRNIRPCAFSDDSSAQILGIIGAIRQQVIVGTKAAQHLERTMAVMGLPNTQAGYLVSTIAWILVVSPPR